MVCLNDLAILADSILKAIIPLELFGILSIYMGEGFWYTPTRSVVSYITSAYLRLPMGRGSFKFAQNCPIYMFHV